MASPKEHLMTALQTASAFTPAGRRLVMQPFQQSIFFEARPALRPDDTWEFTSRFRYIPMNEPLPQGWYELSDVRESFGG